MNIKDLAEQISKNKIGKIPVSPTQVKEVIRHVSIALAFDLENNGTLYNRMIMSGKKNMANEPETMQ